MSASSGSSKGDPNDCISCDNVSDDDATFFCQNHLGFEFLFLVGQVEDLHLGNQ
jgi:hypothetical protein